ncbi:MAG: nitroreductase family protein [Nanoarchaeota archaeon]|nr:nitroreductase family protein [Nanoarchaeota archaeon]MBU1703762.1 nitroreductase family protein [Nanoarchaeota archaeon]
METSEAIKKRRSIRKYQDKPISKDIIEKLIDAARFAPSGMNSQPWHFIAIQDKTKLKQIAEMYAKARDKLKIYPQDTSFLEKTNIILVLSEKTPWAKVDCSFAIQNILLAATDIGLGSLCLGALMLPENIETLRTMCNIPDNLEIVMPIVIGFPDETPEPKPRKEVKEILDYNKF